MGDDHGRFRYDGDVTGYLGTRLLAALVTVVTLGSGTRGGPFAPPTRLRTAFFSEAGRHRTG